MRYDMIWEVFSERLKAGEWRNKSAITKNNEKLQLKTYKKEAKKR